MEFQNCILIYIERTHRRTDRRTDACTHGQAQNNMYCMLLYIADLAFWSLFLFKFWVENLQAQEITKLTPIRKEIHYSPQEPEQFIYLVTLIEPTFSSLM